MKKSMTRRTFLKNSLTATGLTLAASFTPLGFKILNASELKDKLASFKPNVWFELTPDNKIVITVGASEMGQGTHTALGMILADELDADWNQISIVQGGAREEFKNPLLHAQLAVASATVRGFYDILRNVGAAGRAMLVQAAAAKWNVPVSSCITAAGVVKLKGGGKSLTYGELCLDAAKLKAPQKPPLKKETDFRFMGKRIDRVDIPDKAAGKAIYGLDFKVDDMHYAVLARPPVVGAKPVKKDEKAATAVKGVAKIVPTPMGIIVIADSFYAAMEGRKALNVVWDKGTHPQLDTASVEKTMMDELNVPGSPATNKGDAKKALGQAKKKVSATYYVPYIAHTCMEPMNCTAHVQKDRCDIWVPTQGQTVAQLVGAQVAGMPPEKVFIHTTYLGGGFGRRAAPDFLVEAVIASKVLGKPVKVVWTREEDIMYDQFRSATAQRVEAGLDDQGRPQAWSHKVVAGSIMKHIDPKGIKNGVDIMSLWGLVDFPGSDNYLRYEIPNIYIEFLISKLPYDVSPWRSVQTAPNAFITESFIDELAHATGRDPLEFRLSLLKNNKRQKRLLEAVAEKAGWGKPVPKGQGRGLAQHHCFGTSSAQVVDLSVNTKTGAIKVHRVVAALDCGPAVAPFNIQTQIEGAITMAISTALKEEIQIANGGVISNNFDSYNVIRMDEVPDIEVHILKSKERIGGIGEPGVPPTAPAMANAVFNATGARIRRIPMTPDRVLAAIKNKMA